MHMENNKNFIRMMLGDFGIFTQYEVWFLLGHLHDLKINTLKIQKTVDDYFICRVDDLTV